MKTWTAIAVVVLVPAVATGSLAEPRTPRHLAAAINDDRPSASEAATCSNDSLRGTYGFLHDSTDSNGIPSSAAVTQITFDPTTGTFTGETTTSHDGVIATQPITGTYAIASNCTG